MKTFIISLTLALTLGQSAYSADNGRDEFLNLCNDKQDLPKGLSITEEKQKAMCDCAADAIANSIGFETMIQAKDDQALNDKIAQEHPEVITKINECSKDAFTLAPEALKQATPEAASPLPPM